MCLKRAAASKKEPGQVIYGGTMMGIAVPDLEQPILKNTNAILALTKKDAILPEPTACIRCGRCVAHCPANLMPLEIESAFKQKNVERLAELKVNLCMECGCCSHICPGAPSSGADQQAGQGAGRGMEGREEGRRGCEKAAEEAKKEAVK